MSLSDKIVGLKGLKEFKAKCDSTYAKSSAVYDKKITVTQGGVTMGSFTLNQATNTVIALNGGCYLHNLDVTYGTSFRLAIQILSKSPTAITASTLAAALHITSQLYVTDPFSGVFNSLPIVSLNLNDGSSGDKLTIEYLFSGSIASDTVTISDCTVSDTVSSLL